MTFQRFSPTGSGRAAWVLSWLFLLLFSVQVRAGGSGSPGATSVDTPSVASSPGEEVTSLPMVNAASGLTLVGAPRELRAALLDFRGNGHILVRQIDRRLFAVTFDGEYRVRLDRDALVLGNVHAYFQGGLDFTGGRALLTVGDSDPVAVDPARVPLPLARLAADPQAQGALLGLRVIGRAGHRAMLGASLDARYVTVTQRLR